MWIGIKAGFVSEVGAYGLSSLEEMKEILGDELFPFDSAEYYWDTFSTYRWSDSGVFLYPPNLSGDASIEQMREYILAIQKIGVTHQIFSPHYQKFCEKPAVFRKIFYV